MIVHVEYDWDSDKQQVVPPASKPGARMRPVREDDPQRNGMHWRVFKDGKTVVKDMPRYAVGIGILRDLAILATDETGSGRAQATAGSLSQ